MRLTLYICIFLFSAACNVESQYQPEVMTAGQTIAESPVYNDTSYRQILFHDTMVFKIYTLGEGLEKDLVVFVEKDGIILTDLRTRITGNITESRIADLNSNNFPELILTSRKDRKGPSEVLGYEFTDFKIISYNSLAAIRGVEG